MSESMTTEEVRERIAHHEREYAKTAGSYEQCCFDHGDHAGVYEDTVLPIAEERDRLRADLDAMTRERDAALSNLGSFVVQCAEAMGLPAASAPEVVLRQCRVTFAAAHTALNDRDAAIARAEAAEAEVARLLRSMKHMRNMILGGAMPGAIHEKLVEIVGHWSKENA